MEPQDVVVALKLAVEPDWPGFPRLSADTGMSLSQAHRSVARLTESRLFAESERRIMRANLAKFVINGLPFVFPARLGEVTRGVATAWACPLLKQAMGGIVEDDLVPVWPDADGTIRGRAVEPLHAGAIAVSKSSPELYALLALIDVVRVGRARERRFAEAELEKRLCQ